MTLRTFVVVGALTLGVGAATVGADILANHRTVLTFSGAVALPGTELPAGSYTFELADPNASSDAVEVLNRNRTRVLYLGLTRRVMRPANMPAGRSIVFGEAHRGEPAPITAWYPPDENRGYEFIYRR
jgi:hypothetical protein